MITYININTHKYRINDGKMKFLNGGGYTICELSNCCAESAILNHYQFEQPTIVTDNGYFMFLYIPSSYYGEIYWSIKDEEIIISENYYDMCLCVESLTEDQEVVTSFVELNSRTPLERTWFLEIGKCLPRSIYYIENKQFISKRIKLPQLSKEYNEYRFFTQALHRKVISKAAGKCGVLLSGGVDSRLIAYILYDNDIIFSAYSVRYYPYVKDNLVDVENALMICEKLGIPLKIVECNFETNDISKWKQFITTMPSTSHLALSFLALAEVAAADDIETLYTRQNADALYGFGPTNRFKFSISGFGNAYKRLCLSKAYFKTLRNNKEYCFINKILLSFPLYLGKVVTEKIQSKKLYYPKNSKDLIDNFFSLRSGCLVLGEKNSSNSQKQQDTTSSEIYRELLVGKIIGYTKSGDSEAIRNAAHMNGITNVVFPYSGEEILEFFASHQISLQEILKPKLYEYKMAYEFAKKYGKELAIFDLNIQHVSEYKDAKILGFQEFYKYLLKNTIIGHEISKDIDINDRNESWFSFFGRLYSRYWMNKVIQTCMVKY